MSNLEAETRHRRPHTRDVGYRRRYLDPHLELRRKLQTASFLPVVSMIFDYLKIGKAYSGAAIAEYCRGNWSQGTVWNHLHWLSKMRIIQPRFDGKRLWFAWPETMTDEVRTWYSYLLDEIQARRFAQR